MKTYIVTDPCYIVNDTDVWERYREEVINAEQKAKVEDYVNYTSYADYTNADKILSEHLNTYIKSCSTGYGDWSNSIYGNDILRSNFFADTGLVCVCELTDRIKEEYKRNFSDSIENTNGVAMFETEGIEDLEFITDDPDWTVLRVKTKEGYVFSDSCDEDDYEDEDYYEDYEDDYEDDEDYFDYEDEENAETKIKE